jgi:Zn-dependent membrane protease YugP
MTLAGLIVDPVRHGGIIHSLNEGVLQSKVGSSSRNHTSQYGLLAACGLTGERVAQRLLTACGLSEVAVMRSRLRNFYHPRKRETHLNATNFESPSLSALTTAAHEVGHAQQFASDILLCRRRRMFWPICCVLIGLAGILPMLHIADAVHLPINVGNFVLTAVITMAVLQLPIKLPLEYDASRRARKLVQEARLLGPGERRVRQDPESGMVHSRGASGRRVPLLGRVCCGDHSVSEFYRKLKVERLSRGKAYTIEEQRYFVPSRRRLGHPSKSRPGAGSR